MKKIFLLGLVGSMFISGQARAFTVDTSQVCTEDITNLCCSDSTVSTGSGNTGSGTGTISTESVGEGRTNNINTIPSTSVSVGEGKNNTGGNTASSETIGEGTSRVPNLKNPDGLGLPKSSGKFTSPEVADLVMHLNQPNTNDYFFTIEFFVKERDSTNIIGGTFTVDDLFPNDKCDNNGDNCEGSFKLSLTDARGATLTSTLCDYSNSYSTSRRDLNCKGPLVTRRTLDAATYLKVETTGALSAQAYDIIFNMGKTDLSYFKSMNLGDADGDNQMGATELKCLYTSDSGVVPGETDMYQSRGSDVGHGHSILTYEDEKWECERRDRSDYSGIDRTYGYTKKINYKLDKSTNVPNYQVP